MNITSEELQELVRLADTGADNQTKDIWPETLATIKQLAQAELQRRAEPVAEVPRDLVAVRDLVMQAICEMPESDPNDERTITVNYDWLYERITSVMGLPESSPPTANQTTEPMAQNEDERDSFLCVTCNRKFTPNADVVCDSCCGVEQAAPERAKCKNCNGEGYYTFETGGCDPDGENDTRESHQEVCPQCQGIGYEDHAIAAAKQQEQKDD